MHACAYNFPAVLLTVGPSKWPQLNKLLNILLKGELKVNFTFLENLMIFLNRSEDH